MSYILDALKRAESDRGRGSIPGLHTQQVMAGSAGGEGGAGRPAWLWPLVAGTLLLAGGAGLYLVKPLSVRVNAGAVLPPPPPAAALPAPQITAITAVSTAPAPATLPAEPDDAPAKRSARRTAAPLAATPPVAPINEPRIYALADLPADIRNGLPQVTIGGSSYSTNPALRMLMVNGRMYQEKDQAGPDLVLEQIRQGSAIMRFKGYRYRITY